METTQILLLLFAGGLSGFLNTLASSGSAVSLPALIFLGFEAHVANATNRVAILLGTLEWGVWYRRRSVCVRCSLSQSFKLSSYCSI